MGESSEGTRAIAWSDSATVGDIAVTDAPLTGDLAHGLVDCRLHHAGKFRNGAARWWCSSHQCYWGAKADLARDDGRCRLAPFAMHVVIDPVTVDARGLVGTAHPHPHAALRLSLAGQAIRVQHDAIDAIVPALALLLPDGLFGVAAGEATITHLHVTPPALAAMALADGCIDCSRCGRPHLDLGEFAGRVHRRHTCGHCGHDSTYSHGAIVSHPLFRLREASCGRLRIDTAPPA